MYSELGSQTVGKVDALKAVDSAHSDAFDSSCGHRLHDEAEGEDQDAVRGKATASSIAAT